MNGGHFDQAVFVIDDDGEIRRSLEYLFESVGLPSELFENAEAFLHRFDPSRSGCLMIDVRMPGMGGLRLLQQLNSQGSHLPVIVFTGHANVSMAVQ
ncbi:MAG: response regulator transcription factor, partial [Gammaproteobacteria bacterium]